MAASQPAGWPAHNCKGPAAYNTSFQITHKTVLERSRLQTSQTPMGVTPGCLSKAIRQQAVKAERLAGSTRDAANLLATAERESQ